MTEITKIQSDMVEGRRSEIRNIIEEQVRIKDNIYPQNLSRAIKEICDERYKGNWNCHVGPSFGSSFPHESNTYFYGEWDDLSILLYKFN